MLNLKAIGSLRNVKGVKPNGNWKPKKLEGNLSTSGLTTPL